MSFELSTRRRTVILPTLTKPAGGGITRLDLPKVGILSKLWLIITGAVAGSLSAPNAYGMSSIINRVRLSLNSGVDLINLSGPGYAWLLRDFINDYRDPGVDTNARAAVTATTFDVSMVLPVALNDRDNLGLVMLQNEMTLASLEVTWLADASVATGATVTGTCVPVMEYFEVPADRRNWPRFDVLHTVLEDQQAIAGAGEFTYQIPRGATLMGVYHLAPGGVTVARLRAQQGNIIYDTSVASRSNEYATTHGRSATLAGAIAGADHRVLWDFMGTDGLGAFGSIRDVIDTRGLTDIASVIQFAGADTLTTVRRQLVALGA